MNARSLLTSGMILGMAMASAAPASIPLGTQLEINSLLEYIGTSGCEFYRNGTWYDSKRAQAHLRMKYQILLRRNLITSSEDFIALAASKSSITGQLYEIRCTDGSVEASGHWLSAELARLRARGAARLLRAAPHRSGRFNSGYQSSFLTTTVLVTEATPSVARAMARALFTAFWVLALPLSTTAPFLSVST